MRKTYQNEEGFGTSQPDAVSVALAELAGEMREGLLALTVRTGLRVMSAIMEEDVTAACGPKGRHDPDRTAVRHGHVRGSVTSPRCVFRLLHRWPLSLDPASSSPVL